MTVNFSRDMMFGMLDNGKTGTQLLEILNVIVADQNELTQESTEVE